MNITCDNCGKRYKMKASQTKKAFKTKCKRCSHIIVVRPEDFAAQEEVAAPAQVESQPVAASVESVQWYAVVNGSQGGPYQSAQLVEFYQNGMINAESFVWCDGMANWDMISNVSQLQSLFTSYQPASSPQPAAQVSPSSARAEDARHSQEQVQGQSQEQEAPYRQAQMSTGEDAVLTSSASSYQLNRAEPQSTESEPQAAAHAVSFEAQAQSQPQPQAQAQAPVSSSPRVNSVGELTNQRNENSVLFSLDAIDGGIGLGGAAESAPAQRPSTPIVRNTGGSEGSGLIDISALGYIAGSGSSTPDQRSSIQAPLNIGAGGAGPRNLALVKKKTDYKAVAIAVLSVSLVAIGGVFAYQTWIAPPPPVNNQPLIALNAQARGGAALQASRQTTANTAVTSVAASSAASLATSSASSNQATGATNSSQNKISSTSATSSASASSKSKPNRTAQKPKSRRTSKQRRRSSSKSKRPSKPARSKPAKPKTPAVAKPQRRRSGPSAADILAGRSRGGSSALPSTTSRASNLPKKPSRNDVLRVMRSVNVKRCLRYDESLKGRGSIKVKIVARSSGAITVAQVQNSPFRGSPVASCIERAIKQKRFPKFSDPTLSFTFPFKS